MSVSFCLPHPVAVSAFMICRGLCACTEMLWMCVLYVSFGSKVRPRTFGCVAMGSALLFIVRSRLLVYSAGSGVVIELFYFFISVVCGRCIHLYYGDIEWSCLHPDGDDPARNCLASHDSVGNHVVDYESYNTMFMFVRWSTVVHLLTILGT